MVGFSLDGRDVPDGLKQPTFVRPIDRLEGSQLDGFHVAPRSVPMDDRGLVKAVDPLSQGVVVAVTDTAHGGFDARVGQTFGGTDRDVLGYPYRCDASVRPFVPVVICRGPAPGHRERSRSLHRNAF